jgi:hypothetical protein
MRREYGLSTPLLFPSTAKPNTTLGFVLKTDSEGRLGPSVYGRTAHSNFEIGRFLHLKSEIRNLELDRSNTDPLGEIEDLLGLLG